MDYRKKIQRVKTCRAYFYLVKQKSNLPDPSGPLKEKVPPAAIAAANAKVVEAINEAEVKKRASRANGNHSFITLAQKYQVGKRAAEYGITATICHYGNKYPDLVLKESSVRWLPFLLPGCYRLFVEVTPIINFGYQNI